MIFRCHIGATRYNSNISSNKYSGSISSARNVSNISAISLRPTLVQASCQTSLENLNKVEKSSSPIFQCNVLRDLKSQSNRTKLKRNKVFYGESNIFKYQKVKKTESNCSQSRRLCSECIEMEKSRQNADQTNLSMITKSNNVPIFTIDQFPKLTIESQGQLDQIGKVKVAICEESLSECSFSDSLDCKMKKITIKLK